MRWNSAGRPINSKGVDKIQEIHTLVAFEAREVQGRQIHIIRCWASTPGKVYLFEYFSAMPGLMTLK